MSEERSLQHSLDDLAEREPETTAREMAESLGLLLGDTSASLTSTRTPKSTQAGGVSVHGDNTTGPTGTSVNSPPLLSPKTPQREVQPGRGRGGRKRGQGRPSTHSTVSARSLSAASDAVSALMKQAPEPIPTDNDILEQKVDEVSVASGRLEEELEREREIRRGLETRLLELERSHNQLAGKLTILADLMDTRTRGTSTHPSNAKGITTASTLLSDDQSSSRAPVSDRLAPVPPKPSQQARGGLASGKRRGGM